MLYITTAPFSLLSYCIYENHQTEKDAITLVEKLDNAQLKNLLTQGDFLTPKIYGISLQNEKPPLNLTQSVQNTTYISITNAQALKQWKELIEEKEWIQEFKLTPERYKSIINQTQIFTEESEEWFWRKFKFYPEKMKREILNLESRFQTKVPLYLLQAFYSAVSIDLFIKLRNCLGNKEATLIIEKLSSSELWSFFIGTSKYPSYIESNFISIKKKAEDTQLEIPLMYLKEAVENKTISVKVAAVLLNQWLLEVDTKRIQGTLKLKYSIEDLKRLKKYLGIY